MSLMICANSKGIHSQSRLHNVADTSLSSRNNHRVRRSRQGLKQIKAGGDIKLRRNCRIRRHHRQARQRSDLCPLVVGVIREQKEDLDIFVAGSRRKSENMKELSWYREMNGTISINTFPAPSCNTINWRESRVQQLERAHWSCSGRTSALSMPSAD